ncbi:hypothetical protein [Glutamicibacter arilaitensis]|uniref:hypothetical protein n=1 Tax=Glutamicibacter arilaitensis TaxID=256701 RepID=UPI0038510524
MKSRISVPRLALRWATAAIIIVALAVTSAIVANRTLFSAEHAVESLHKHLIAGEGAEALGLMGAQVPQGDAVALDGEVLKRTQAGITEFDAQKADPSENDPDVHTVIAKYKANGVDQESTYTLRRSGKSWLFFDQWSFEPVTLPTVQIKANTVNEVAVNDQKIPLVKGVSTLAVFYPSITDASFSTKNFEADTRGVVVTGPAKEPVEISLKTQPTKEFIAQVNSKVRTYLNECAAQQVLMPSGCPFAYHTPSRVNPETIEWSIAKYPTIEVNYYNGAWVLSPLKVTAKLSLTEQDLRTGTLEKKTVNEQFSFTAQLTTSTSEVSVVPVAGTEE